MATGILRIQAFAARQSSPVEGVTVTITGDGFTVTRRTDAEGSAGDVTLTTPDCALSLDENNTTTRPYAVCDLTAFKEGWRTVRIQGVQVFPGQVTLAQLGGTAQFFIFPGGAPGHPGRAHRHPRPRPVCRGRRQRPGTHHQL